MKPLLLIETATERGMVSFMDGDQILHRKDLPFGINSSKYMISAIQQGLLELNIKTHDLSFVAVGVGPGSFTGIRVAAATAQSIAYAARIPLVGVSTLACFVPTSDGRYVVLIDAKMGGVYAMTATRLQGAILDRSEPTVLQWDALEDILSEASFIVTPNSKVIKYKFEAIYGSEREWQEMPPDAFTMHQLARENYRGEVIQKPLELQYLRKSQVLNQQ